MNDIQKYQSTEVLYVEQFGGELIEDSRQWLIDADVLTPDGKTVSIKDQFKSSLRYGNIAVELEIFNSERGLTKPGWFEYIQTTGLSILAAHPDTGDPIWIRCKPEKLQEWVSNNKNKIKPYQLRPETVRHNQKQGRTYTNSKGFLIPVLSLIRDGFSFTPLEGTYKL